MERLRKTYARRLTSAKSFPYKNSGLPGKFCSKLTTAVITVNSQASVAIESYATFR